MKYKEFLEYLESNLEGYNIFMRKARQFQGLQNAKRKKKWSDEKVEKAAYDMWRMSLEPLYINLKHEINSDSRLSWISFIENHEVMENVNESINDIDFTGDVA